MTEDREELEGMLEGADVKKEVLSGDWEGSVAVGGMGRSCGDSMRTGTTGELLRGGVGMRGMGDCPEGESVRKTGTTGELLRGGVGMRGIGPWSLLVLSKPGWWSLLVLSCEPILN